MKKILMYTNYFYPDIQSSGHLMTEICDELKDLFEFSVISAREEQKEKVLKENYNGIKILRVKTLKNKKSNKFSRIKYIFYYFINALHIGLRQKSDIVFALSLPQVLGGWLGVITKFFNKSKFIYCIHDMSPEIIEALGYSKNKIIIEMARFLDICSCKYADIIIVIGNDVKEKLKKRIPKLNMDKVIIINNWADENKLYPLDKKDQEVKKIMFENGITQKDFVIMYSGNLGMFYDLENIIKIFYEFKDYKDLKILFVGEGAKKEEMMRYVRDNHIKNVLFSTYQPQEKLLYSLNMADIHLITNQKGIKGISVPSKLYGIMAVGKPIIGILEKGSEAANIVKRSNCGVIVEPQDYKNITKLIKYIYFNRDKFLIKGKNGRLYLEKYLTKNNSIERYKKVFEEL